MSGDEFTVGVCRTIYFIFFWNCSMICSFCFVWTYGLRLYNYATKIIIKCINTVLWKWMFCNCI